MEKPMNWNVTLKQGIAIFYGHNQIKKLKNTNNEQLLDEVEHDIMNYQNRGLCTDRRF